MSKVDTFMGVSVLHLFPLLSVLIWLLLYRASGSRTPLTERVARVWQQPLRVGWLVLASIFGGLVWYYLSRTGNHGFASSVELELRHTLDHVFGVRPRTKEWLIGHPCLLLAAYLHERIAAAPYLLVLGVIGQLSLISTFTHLHTPLDVSLLRTMYGILLGCIIAFIYYGIGKLTVRGWRHWVFRQNRL